MSSCGTNCRASSISEDARNFDLSISFSHHGEKASWLVTSLFDRKPFPKKELIGMHHERWEHELVYDDLETEMLLSEENLRCKTVDGIRHEVWRIQLAFNLIRMEMASVAEEAEVSRSRSASCRPCATFCMRGNRLGWRRPGRCRNGYARRGKT